MTSNAGPVETVKGSFKQLLSSYEQLREHLKTSDEISMDFVERKIREQTRILQSIEEDETAEKRFSETQPEAYESLMKELNSLRNELEKLLKGKMDSVEKQLESMDQSLDLMDEYQQENDDSYYLDETI